MKNKQTIIFQQLTLYIFGGNCGVFIRIGCAETDLVNISLLVSMSNVSLFSKTFDFDRDLCFSIFNRFKE